MNNRSQSANDIADTNPRSGGGWIKAWRKLDTNTTLQEADVRGVFLTLLLRATTKPIQVFVRRIGRYIRLEEGQCYISLGALSELGLSKKRARTILKILEGGNIITLATNAGITVVTVLNFQHYQENAKKGHTQGHTQDATKPLGPIGDSGQNEDRGTPRGKHGAHMGHTEQEGEEGLPIGTGQPVAVPLVNPAAVIFTQCRAVLEAGGINEKNARSLLGKWRKSHGDPAVIEIVTAASEKAVSDPVSWIEAALKQRGGASGDGMSRAAI